MEKINQDFMIRLSDLESFNAQIYKKLYRICKPLLKNLDLNYFGQTRIFSDGSGTAMVANSKIVTHWVTNGYPIPVGLKPGFNLASQVVQHFPAEACLDLKETFGLDNILFFVDINCDYTDVYLIASDPESKDTLYNYMNYSPSIRDFLKYFNEESKILMDEAAQNKLFVPIFASQYEATLAATRNLSQSLIDQARVEANLSYLKHHLITKLSKMEFVCLKHAAENKTAKETARFLKISYRTVETYLDNVKFKLKCVNKRDAIQLFREGCD